MKYTLLQLLLLFSCCLSAHTKYTTANLNLRSGPNTKTSVITVLPKGTSVTIDEDCDCKWVAVSYCGYVGYVNSNYISNKKPSYHRSSNTTRTYRAQRRYYTNSNGYRVQSPSYYNSTPSGATAICRDGTYSFSRSRRGTCSHHGGVYRWL